MSGQYGLEKSITAGRVGDENTALLDRLSIRQRHPVERFFAALTRWRIILLTQLLDMVVIIAISSLVGPFVEHGAGGYSLQNFVAAILVAGISHFSFFKAGLYEINMLMDPVRSLAAIILRLTVTFLLFAALGALLHEAGAFSRLWFAGFYICGIAALGLERSLISRLIRAWIDRGNHALSVAIVGGNPLTEKLIARFANNQWGIRIIGVFDDRTRDNVRHIAGVQILGTIDDLLEYSKVHELDTVVVTLPITASDRIQAVIRRLRQQPLNVRVLPGEIGLAQMSPIRLAPTELPGVQLIAIADRPISEFSLFAKAAFDRAVAATALLIAMPVLAACVVGIKISSPGPVFFRQKRIGYKGREFNIFKFRTMHVSARPNTVLTQRNDPRVFKFGGILRKTSLDELPQLLNVLLGDMSLVGPRPHMPEARAAGVLYFESVAEYADRQRVKPGITGWAQVNGWRGPTDTVEQIARRVEHDIYYIENWSLLLDLMIIFKTLLVGFYGKNAF
jgi:Undecaprenyl-phosphate glucose phosphotransferase